MNYRIGGCGVHLTNGVGLPATADGFIDPQAPCDLLIDCNAAARPRVGQRRFQADQVWERWESADAGQIRWNDAVSATVLATLTFDLGWPRRCSLWHTPQVTSAALLFEYPLLQLALIDYWSDHASALVHTCGLIDDGAAVLLFGPPEAGKSTSARLWQAAGATILSDDRVVVRVQDGRLWAYGTPWHSSTPLVSPLAAPIKAALALRHGPANTASLLSPAAAARRLLPEIHLPLWSAPAVDQAMAVADALATSVPCYDFAFVPHASAVDYVRNLLR